jgi:signal transduction histidine kinase
VAVGQLAVCVGLAVAEGASALVLAVTAIPLHITGAGWIWYELVVSLGRGLARLSRRHVREWTSTEIAEPYLPPMRAPARRPDGLYRVGNRLYRNPRRAARRQRHDWIMTDAVTWRELLWLVLDPVLIGLVVLPLSAFCIVGFCALVWPWLWWPIVRPFLAYNPATPWQILTNWWSGGPEILHMAAAGPIAGVLLTGAGLLLAPPVARLYVWWTRLSLAPSGRAKLASRIEELSESRDLSTQVRDAELRRIERDLHDGSQARLLAIGLKLDAVKALVDADPDAARAAVSEVQQDTGTAIRELRALVRGIHPPVLAERGLADAIRALVLDSALAVTVRIEIGRPLEQPIETALYFAVSELLSNVTKHAGAATSKIEMREQGDHVVVTVTDDGRGGADPARGSGLAGIARRIAPFDGTLEISSPDGGPTRAVITIPVAGDAS